MYFRLGVCMKGRAHVDDERMQMFSMAVLEKAVFHMNNTKEQKNWEMRYNNERGMQEGSPSYHLLNVTNWTTVVTQTESKDDKVHVVHQGSFRYPFVSGTSYC